MKDMDTFTCWEWLAWSVEMQGDPFSSIRPFLEQLKYSYKKKNGTLSLQIQQGIELCKKIGL